MQYVNKSFTLPTTNRRMTQTDYEIAVGLRNPDGTLVMSTDHKTLTKAYLKKHRVDLRKCWFCSKPATAGKRPGYGGLYQCTACAEDLARRAKR